MKNIIITGAAGNLGQVVVDELYAEGYNILATLGPHDKTERLDCTKAKGFPLELSDEEKVSLFVNDSVENYKSINAGIMIAGGFAMGNIHDTDGEALRQMYSLNFETAYFMARKLFLQMEKQQNGGKLIFIGARPAFTAGDAKIMMAYAMSKSLLFRLAEILNEEGKDKNISASVIVPGTIDTPANRSAMPDTDFNKWVSREAIADTIKFVLSETGNSLRETVIKVYNKS